MTTERRERSLEPDDIDRQIIELCSQGRYTDSEIGERVGRHRVVVNRRRKRLGIPPYSRRPAA